jgi:hypothetical protein
MTPGERPYTLHNLWLGVMKDLVGMFNPVAGIRRGCWRVYDVQISTSQWRSRSHNSQAGFCINFKLSLFVDILETEKDLKKKSFQQNKDYCIIIKPTGLSCGPSFVSRKKKQKKEQSILLISSQYLLLNGVQSVTKIHVLEESERVCGWYSAQKSCQLNSVVPIYLIPGFCSSILTTIFNEAVWFVIIKALWNQLITRVKII